MMGRNNEACPAAFKASEVELLLAFPDGEEYSVCIKPSFVCCRRSGISLKALFDIVMGGGDESAGQGLIVWLLLLLLMLLLLVLCPRGVGGELRTAPSSPVKLFCLLFESVT